MDVTTFEVNELEARTKWEQYQEGCKKFPEDTYYREMKDIYSKLKLGKTVIDVGKAIRDAGTNHFCEPRLAIGRADMKTVQMHYHSDGTVHFYHKEKTNKWSYTNQMKMRRSVKVRGFEPLADIYREATLRGMGYEINRTTCVPPIPPQHRPVRLERYYIMWEVDEWDTFTPPGDPLLLRRINGNFFVVLAVWDMTDLEKAVLAGRLVL